MFLRHKRLQHVLRKNSEQYLECPVCFKVFKLFVKFKQHLFKCNSGNQKLDCTVCGKKFNIYRSAKRHMLNCANQFGYGRNLRLPKLPKDSVIKLSKRAFKSYLQQYEIIPENDLYDCEQFFSYYSDQIIKLINSLLNLLDGIKIQFCLQVTFFKELTDVKTYQIAYFCTENFLITT